MASGAHNPSPSQPVRAPRGTTLSCKGWPQEAILRMLLNSLDPDVPERPRELVISGSAGKAAADREALDAIAAALRALGNDETLLVDSGHIERVSRTAPHAPRVVATCALGETFGDWLQTGAQTELPVVHEIYGAAARRHFGGTLAGRLVVSGCMHGAEALASALHGAAFLGIDADGERIKRNVKTGYCEVMVNNLDESLRILKNAVRQRKSVSIGLLGNSAELLSGLAQRGVVPDLLTDSTAGPAQVQATCDLTKLGSLEIDATRAAEFLQPLYDGGWRLTTWQALSGEPADIARLDRLALDTLRDDERLQHWLPIAGRYVRFQGLPARVAWLRLRDLGTLAAAANGLVARRELAAPVLLGYRSAPGEKLYGRVASLDNGANWLWTTNPEPVIRGPNQCSAQAAVADGTPEAAERLSRWTGA